MSPIEIFLTISTILGLLWSVARELYIRELTKEFTQLSHDAIGTIKDVGHSLHNLQTENISKDILEKLHNLEIRLAVGLTKIQEHDVNIQVNQGGGVTGTQK